jgi:hypothetical protein
MLNIYISVLIFNLVATFMKKKLSPLLFYACIYFAIFWAEVSDRFADKYKLYYFFNPKVIEVQTFWILLGIYPAATMIIINWFPYRKSWTRKAVYILAWSLFSTLYEWMSLRTGFLHYDYWKLWYSGIVYPFIFSALMFNVYLLNWMNRNYNTGNKN